jgi:hypothetical protein
MSSLLEFGRDVEYDFVRGLAAYVAKVAKATGVGFESCLIDPDEPSTAYLALDCRSVRYPEYDLALLWDEVHGWSAGIEHDHNPDPTVLAYLGGPLLIPDPRAVVLFLARVRAGDLPAGRVEPPVFRAAGRHEELVEHFPVPPRPPQPV